MASVVSEKFCYLILLKHLPAPDFPPSRLIIVVSGTVTANAAAWFLLCKLTILSLLLTGQENSPPLMRSVLACGEHHLGGCHVFGAAVRDPGIKCIVSQLAFADGEEIVTGNMNNEEKEAFLSTLDKMAEKQKNTGKEMFVGVNRVLSDAESKSFFEENRTQYPKMDIKIPFLTVRETLLYKPALNASQVMCPTLIVIAGQDTVNPPEQGRALFDAVGAKEKRLYEESSARHYDIYAGEHFKQVISIQTEWFKTHL